MTDQQTDQMGRAELRLPRHKCGLYLTHNEHRDVYESVEQHVVDIGLDDDDWVSSEEKKRSVESGEFWLLQWYPDTPIGFHRIAAASLGALLEAAKDEEDSWCQPSAGTD